MRLFDQSFYRKWYSKNVYVAMTSIFGRQSLLLNTLKSIKDQTLQPTKCYIYLSEEPYLVDSGFTNKQLKHQELEQFLDSHQDLFEVRWTKNTGPYRKLLPLLKDKWNEDCVIITLDDDSSISP